MRKRLVTSNFGCPGCKQQISPDSLLPNKELRAEIETARRKRLTEIMNSKREQKVFGFGVVFVCFSWWLLLELFGLFLNEVCVGKSQGEEPGAEGAAAAPASGAPPAAEDRPGKDRFIGKNNKKKRAKSPGSNLMFFRFVVLFFFFC